MSNFIKKIYEKNFDDDVHLQFQKFSRGEFKNRAEISAKQSKGKYTINMTAEFVNELVKELARKLGDEKTHVMGSIISTSDLTGKINFKSKKQFQGVKNYGIDGEMSGEEILMLLKEFPRAFFALSFKTNDSEIKTKPKAPKSGKPKAPKEGEKKKKPDFCKPTTTDKKLAESSVFEKHDFKNAEATHTYMIESIVIPQELKEEKDFAKVREMSRRKGKIIRDAIVDGKEIRTELEFEA